MFECQGVSLIVPITCRTGGQRVRGKGGSVLKSILSDTPPPQKTGLFICVQLMCRRRRSTGPGTVG